LPTARTSEHPPVPGGAADLDWPEPQPGFGGALLDRFAPPPEPRPGLSRGAYAMALLGSLGVAAALAWRFLR
jgi:hypothetical protein